MNALEAAIGRSEKVLRLDEEHNVGELLLGYFSHAFPTFCTLIFGNYGVFHGSKKIRRNVEPFGVEEEGIISAVRKNREAAISKQWFRHVKTRCAGPNAFRAYYESPHTPSKKDVGVDGDTKS